MVFSDAWHTAVTPQKPKSAEGHRQRPDKLWYWSLPAVTLLEPAHLRVVIPQLGALVATLAARRLARHDRRQHVVLDGLLGHHDLGDVVAARDVVHHRKQNLFHDGAQA